MRREERKTLLETAMNGTKATEAETGQGENESVTIDVRAVEREAYEWGYADGSRGDPVDESDEEAVMLASEGVSERMSSAFGVNVLHKNLKLMAGFRDVSPMAPESRDVTVIVDGETSRVNSWYVYDALVDQWRSGAMDGVTGRESEFEGEF